MPKIEALEKSISATTTNGRRLLDDAKTLFDFDRFSTALALAVLAQEEFSKAFLLQLVLDGALPWLPEVRRSMARHQSKHLLAIVMEWLPPFDWDEIMEQDRRDKAHHEEMMAWLQRSLDRYRQGNLEPDPDDPEPVEPDFAFPPEVAKALNIYRHEEIERLGSGNPWKDEDWATGKARKIADGSLDKKKQSAFYVDITKTAEVGSHPERVTREEASEEIERAKRFSEGPITFSHEYRKLREALPHIFAGMKGDDADG
jgi:AbiV family abortive infection protein